MEGRLTKTAMICLGHPGQEMTQTDDRRLTMDPNTVSKMILLSEGNRRARRTREPQPYPDHPERFDNSLEVLCGESLTGRWYWELETSGYASVGVAYGSIDRKEARGWSDRRSDKLWFCVIHHDGAGSHFIFYHNRGVVLVPGPRLTLYRLGVYLDWPAGILSFYQVSADDDTLTHLHTYNTTFTEPLYPWFSIYGEVTLCRVYQSNDGHSLQEPTAIAGRNYKMDSSPLGVCVIINNLFEKETRPRKGTDKDAEDLTKVFSWLGFKVLKCEEKTKKDMSDILELVSKLDKGGEGRGEERRGEEEGGGEESLNALRKHTLKEWYGGKFVELKELPRHGDAFVCCILSHGNKDGVSGVDRQTLPNNEIYLPFYGTTCPALAGKPKIFIIQACRGSDGMKQVSVEADDLSIFLHSYKPDVFETEPDGANFLIARAIVEGFVSYRAVDPTLSSYGSWFIQTLCDQLKEGCPRGDDVYKILHEVNYLTGLKITPQLTTQAPEFSSTMTKALVFPRPSLPPPL